MALIPPDAGIRMRMQTESSLLQPLAPVRGIPADLPDLQLGQRFTARIQEALPENTFKALVAGKQLTLQLPEGAKAGDELELVVVDRSPKAIIARQVAASSPGTGEAVITSAYPFARFSPAARLISQLLPAEGEKPQPALLNRGQPLLAQAPTGQIAADTLAPALAKAVVQSGMFYEAHQAQWVGGKLPLAQLLLEPQGQRSSPTAFQHAVAELEANSGAPSSNPTGAQVDKATLQTPATKVGADVTASSPPNTASSTPGLARQVPDDLRPMVQQQLEAAGSQRMVWHGEIWPRQTLEWQIEWRQEREADGSEEEGMRWQTTLSLTTPRLGRVDALLQLTRQGVRIALATPAGASAADLREQSPTLAEALSAAGVELLSFLVRETEETENA
jgi:hypothetical protein